MAFDSYAALSDLKVGLLPQLNFHFVEIFSTVRRRLSIRQTISNPYKIVVRHKIHQGRIYSVVSWHQRLPTRFWSYNLNQKTSARRFKECRH